MRDEQAVTDAYALLDAGDGRRLERFGALVVDRPQPGADGPQRQPAAWPGTDLRFDREQGWTGDGRAAADADWSVRLEGVRLRLRPTAAGQVGCFPEHAAMLTWLRARIAERRAAAATTPPAVLHLFAYTGLATLAAAAEGAAVTHVDASRPTVAWARDNAAANDLAEAPIRWIVDDAAAYAAREVRRRRRYEGVILDPPTYGHGESGRDWRIERDLPLLLETIDDLLAPDGFVLLTAHTPALGPDRLGALLEDLGRPIEAGELRLVATSGARLYLGAYSRADGAS
jgi:23S rRNA (cytosine1962-C5)-methyltransferase